MNSTHSRKNGPRLTAPALGVVVLAALATMAGQAPAGASEPQPTPTTPIAQPEVAEVIETAAALHDELADRLTELCPDADEGAATALAGALDHLAGAITGAEGGDTGLDDLIAAVADLEHVRWEHGLACPCC